MSLLTPLYALGLVAVSLPIIFHLIRRQPRGQFEFSSLMFLSPSPPRLARRSRLDHLLLLLLRGLAISLLALAFARPFLRNEPPPEATDAKAARIAIILDTSASMRRGDLWGQAVASVDKAMADNGPRDEIAIFTCDDALRPLVDFENMSQIAPAERRAAVRSRLQELSPSWASNHLGQGLMDAVEIVSNVGETRGAERIARRILLVSDLQEGSRLGVLADYPWPEDIELELRTVTPSQPTNAGLHYVSNAQRADAGADEREVRVRVSNDANSNIDEFQLAWIDESEKPVGDPTAAYVPAGESRVIRIRRPPTPAAAERLRLSGDAFDFDNTLYFSAGDNAPTSVLYLGDDRGDDPQNLRFYLERALSEGISRSVSLETATPDKLLAPHTPTTVPLMVVADTLSNDQARGLRAYAKAGGSVLVVLTESHVAGELAALVGVPTIDVEEANPNGYAMLGRIDFSHPLFAPMAGPHFNDFTQIHFWKYRQLKPDQLGAARVVARFENGDPALVETTVGNGRVLILTSGWHPADSQLARSWKFVLLVATLLNGGSSGSAERAYFTVNEPVTLGERAASDVTPTITKPDGTVLKLATDARSFTATDQPGIYVVAGPDIPRRFAVNLDPLESKTAPVGAETLEQLGCRLVKPIALADADKKHQRLQDAQLEGRQKIWQWLIAAVLGLVVAETWLAGRAARPAATEGSLA
jgi:hypothetical protein